MDFVHFAYASYEAHPALALCLLSLEEYEKKSNAFIEIEGISGAKTAAGKTIQASQLRSEMEGIKKLINGGDLQCKEDFAGVAGAQIVQICLLCLLCLPPGGFHV